MLVVLLLRPVLIRCVVGWLSQRPFPPLTHCVCHRLPHRLLTPQSTQASQLQQFHSRPSRDVPSSMLISPYARPVTALKSPRSPRATAAASAAMQQQQHSHKLARDRGRSMTRPATSQATQSSLLAGDSGTFAAPPRRRSFSRSGGRGGGLSSTLPSPFESAVPALASAAMATITPGHASFLLRHGGGSGGGDGTAFASAGGVGSSSSSSSGVASRPRRALSSRAALVSSSVRQSLVGGATQHVVLAGAGSGVVAAPTPVRVPSGGAAASTSHVVLPAVGVPSLRGAYALQPSPIRVAS